MNMWRSQRGEIPVGCVVGLIFAAIVAMIGIKVTPLMMRMGDLERDVRILADKANRIEYNDKVIAEQIIKSADKYNLPVTDENIVIDRGRHRIVVTVTYTKMVEFPGYTYQWDVRIFEDRPLF